MDIHNIQKKYSNGEITIVWQSAKCIHSGNCVKHLPQVFKPRQQPWIVADAASTPEIIEAVAQCPSGALSIEKNNAK